MFTNNSFQSIPDDTFDQFNIENHNIVQTNEAGNTNFQIGQAEGIHNMEGSNQQTSSLIIEPIQCTTYGALQQYTSTKLTTDISPSEVTNIQQTNLLRKSSRDKRPPLWMKDFVSLNIHQDKPYTLSKFISYDNISPTYQSFIAASSSISEPTIYHEAIKDPRWIETMKNELNPYKTITLGI